MQQEETDVVTLLAWDLDQHFHSLIMLYQHRLYAFALRHVGNPHDAEDLVQEAFIQAYYALGRYPKERIRSLALLSWLYRILLNLVYNWSKHQTYVRILPYDFSQSGEVMGLMDDEREQPDQMVESREAVRELETFVAQLPESYRAAINLYYFEGYSQQEVAQLLNQPLGTVKSALHRGTMLLRNALRTQQQNTRC